MSFEDEMAAALDAFVTEAAEMLVEIETGLLELERGSTDEDCINGVFRAVHTIKGSSGLFGLDDVVRFAHVVESVLDRVRDHEVLVSDQLIGALLPCKDHLAELLDRIPAGATAEQLETGAVLLAGLERYLTTPAAAAPVETDDAPTWTEVSPAGAEGSRRVHLSLRFGGDCLRNGMDPLSFLRYLAGYGDVAAVTVMTPGLPELRDLDAESCHLGLEVSIDTAATVADLLEVFDFVVEDSDIRVLDASAAAEAFADLVRSYGPEGDVVLAALVADGLVGPDARPEPGAGTEPGALVPASVAEVGSVSEAVVPPAPVPSVVEPAAAVVEPSVAAPAVPAPRAAEQRTIRVDAARLDRLIDAVGELVIAGAGVGLLSSLVGDEALENSVGEVMRLVEEVRDDALQLRMVPIGTTFSRFQRVVRDVSAGLGKDVQLVVTGGETEVDKALVEQIGDPLTHLVRNALDHGIEPAEVRLARGKPAAGTLRLNAFHDSGSIVIEVQDDGGGIDADAVLAKAVERGLVAPGVTLTEQETFALIFAPGFSTAAQVSDLSGRGVGMDVVKRNVSSLRGTIDVHSVLGEGTTMRIRLPLTLAIIDGFLVGVGGATYVIPLDRVVECVELPRGLRRDYMDLRGEVLPFVRLRELFGNDSTPPTRENVVVVEYAGTKTGLVVDALKGGFQTVIKPLGRMFDGVPGIGGSTILGNGDVALIIDVPVLVRRLTEAELPEVAPVV